jgi:hypothetical protein
MEWLYKLGGIPAIVAGVFMILFAFASTTLDHGDRDDPRRPAASVVSRRTAGPPTPRRHLARTRRPLARLKKNMMARTQHCWWLLAIGLGFSHLRVGCWAASVVTGSPAVTMQWAMSNLLAVLAGVSIGAFLVRRNPA